MTKTQEYKNICFFKEGLGQQLNSIWPNLPPAGLSAPTKAGRDEKGKD